MSDNKTRYRYDASVDENGACHVNLRRYTVVRETPCFEHVVPQGFNRDWVKHKRVKKGAVRRYCYPTTEEAMTSFKARQRSRVGRAEYELFIANVALRLVGDGEPQATYSSEEFF